MSSNLQPASLYLKQTCHDQTFQPLNLILTSSCPTFKSRFKSQISSVTYEWSWTSNLRKNIEFSPKTATQPARFAVNKSTSVGFVSRTRSRRFNYRRIRDEIFNSTSRILVRRGSHEPPREKKKVNVPRDEDGHLVTIALKYRDYFAPSPPFLPRRRRRCVTFRFNLQRFTTKFQSIAAARSN